MPVSIGASHRTSPVLPRAGTLRCRLHVSRLVEEIDFLNLEQHLFRRHWRASWYLTLGVMIGIQLIFKRNRSFFTLSTRTVSSYQGTVFILKEIYIQFLNIF